MLAATGGETASACHSQEAGDGAAFREAMRHQAYVQGGSAAPGQSLVHRETEAMKILASITAAVALVVLLMSCGQGKESPPAPPGHEGHEHTHEAGAAEPSATQQYTCTMHPEVVTSAPGDCPKCGMKLVPKT